jgi:hypothetical protein
MSKPTKISRVRPGDQLSASHYNQLVDAINWLHDEVGGPPKAVEQQLRLVQLHDDVNRYREQKTGHGIYTTGTWSEGNDPILEWGSFADQTRIAEVQGSIHLAGERLPLWWDKSNGRHWVFPVANWHMAKLTSTLSPGSSATATIWKYGTTAEEASAITGVTVYDWLLGEDSGSLPSGTRVIVMPHRQSRRWYVVSTVQYPLKDWARATADAAYTTASATVAGTLTNQYGFGPDHDDTSVTLHNLETKTAGLYVFSGASGSACWAKYSGYDDDWLIVITECP